MTSRILVIDDSSDIRDVMRTLLEIEGFTVETAEDCMNIWPVMAGFGPDVILLDMQVPGLQPEIFIEEAMQKFPGIRIIIVSAIANLSRRAAELNIKYCIQKPFEADLLIELIRSSDPAVAR